jgi:chaperonin cofactor prefoldin
LKALEKAGKSDKELEKKLELLTVSHKQCLDKITDQKSRYQIIDQAIEDELRHASRRCWKRLECCGILKT